MAQRRMFSKAVVESGRFLLLSHEAQLFYFHIGMEADDYGFVDCFTAVRLLQTSNETILELVENGFLREIPGYDYVYYIIDWPRSNHVPEDRRQPSIYKQFLESVRVYPDKMESRSHPRKGKE